MRRLTLVLAGGFLTAVGCAEEVRRDQPLSMNDVPEEIRKIAEKELPDIKFDQAWKTKFKGQDAYELRGKNNRGRVREVEVSTAGRVLEIE